VPDKPIALVTGGTGFIGRPLCRALLDAGYRVSVLSRHPESARDMPAGDLKLIASLDQLAPDIAVQVIVNLAGEPLAAGRWSSERKKLFFSSRVGTTEILFDYFSRVETPPEVLVNGSAIGYYGAQGSNILDEKGDFAPGFSHDLCSAWEAAADRFQALGTRVSKVRTGMVLGPDGGALAAMLPPFRFGLGGPIGSGKQWVSWIHRDDLVAMILHCLNRKDMSGPVNGTAPGVVTNREFAKTLGKVLRRPAFLPAPAFMLKLIFGEMAEELLLSGQKVYPRKALQTHFTFQYPDLESALRQVLNR